MPAPLDHASEDAMLHAAVNSFLEQADTKALHTAFTKSEVETRALRENVASLRETVSKNADENKALYEAVTTLRATVSGLQDRITRCEGLEAKYEVLHGKYHDLQDKYRLLHNTAEELRRATVEQFQGAKEHLRSEVAKVEGRMIEVMNRQDDFEAALEQVGHMLQTGRFPPERDQRQTQTWVQAAAPIASADRYGRDPGFQRDREPLVFNPDEEVRTHVREGVADADDQYVAPGPSADSPEPRRTRRWTAKVDGQQLTQAHDHAHAYTHAQTSKQSTAANMMKADDRAMLVAEHWRAAKHKYSAASAKNQRKFVWDFIKGFKDPEFITWFQELLLMKLPKDMVHPRAHPNRGPGGEIIAFTTKVTWDAVSQVFQKMKTPPFFFTVSREVV